MDGIGIKILGQTTARINNFVSAKPFLDFDSLMKSRVQRREDIKDYLVKSVYTLLLPCRFMFS